MNPSSFITLATIIKKHSLINYDYIYYFNVWRHHNDMMQVVHLATKISLLLLVLFYGSFAAVDQSPKIKHLQQLSANVSAPSSLFQTIWPRQTGCWNRPWICRDQPSPENNRPPYPPRRRMRCCRNRCVDVSSDFQNCGLCGIRCPFTWQCCRGLCRNINISPFHCGRCEHRCRFPSFCFYGICGYAQPLPPRHPPFPFPPRQPHPPKPFPPEKPHPPHKPYAPDHPPMVLASSVEI